MLGLCCSEPWAAAASMQGKASRWYGWPCTELSSAWEALSTTVSLGIKTSCTVQAAGSSFASRDGGEWVQAPGGAKVDDFIKSLGSAYAALNRGRLPRPCKALAVGESVARVVASPALSRLAVAARGSYCARLVLP